MNHPAKTLTTLQTQIAALQKQLAAETACPSDLPEILADLQHQLAQIKTVDEELVKKLTGAIEHTADMVLITDRDGRLEYVNPTFEKLTGYKKEEVLGQTPRILKSGRYDQPFYEQLWQTILAGEVLRVEFTNKKKNGELFEQSATITPIKDHEGQVTHFVATCQDITRQVQTKLAEQQLHDRVQQQHQTLIGLSINPAITAGRLNEALPEVTRAVADTLMVERVSIWQLTGEPASQLVCLTAYSRASGEHSHGQVIETLAYPTYLAAMETGEVVSAADVAKDRRTVELFNDYWQPHGITSVMDAPIRLQGKIIGFICHEHVGEPRHWAADEITFAAQTADMVAQAFMHAKAHRQRDELEAIGDILRALNASRDVEEAMPVIVQNLKNITGCKRVSLFVTAIKNNRSFSKTLCTSSADVPLGNFGQFNPSAAMPNLLAGYPHQSPDLALESDFPVEKALVEAGYQSRLSLPLRIEERILGALSLAWPGKAGYNLNHLPLLSQITDAIALAIERKRLLDEAHQRALQQEALNAIVSAAVAAPDMLHLAETALDYTLQALSMEMGSIWIADQQAYRGLTSQNTIPILETIKSKHLPADQPVSIDNWEQEALSPNLKIMADRITAGGIRTSLFMPILAEGAQVGGLIVADAAPYAWTTAEMALVEAVSKQLGGAAERLQLLEQTRNQAQLMRQIINTVPEGVIFLDSNQEVVLANYTAQSYLELLAEPGRLGGQSLEKLLQPPPADQLFHQLVIPQPAEKIFELVSRPFAKGETVAGWVLAIREVTELRKIQEQAQEQERLAAVGQLAAGIAHDFNNLLTGIIGFAELLNLRIPIAPPGPEYLERIIKSGRQASNLIAQILDFSRKSVSQQQELDLTPFLKESIKFLERTIPENIHIVLDLTPGEYRVMADPTKIQQVLTNLAVNARDVMPAGGELRVKLSRFNQTEHQPGHPDIPPGEWVVLAVSDTGAGIPKQIQSHIFEPFFTTKERGKGTGLGLAQVYGIIKQHGGHIDVFSQVGRGATFTIYLPAPTENRPQQKPVENNQVIFGNGETILLVEDDPYVLEVNTDILNSLGYNVITATNGQEAIEVYHRHHQAIALILTDMMMPKMDGITLFNTLRAEQPNLKFVIITGYPLTEQGQKALNEGAITWLQKPVNIAQMAQIVRKMITE